MKNLFLCLYVFLISFQTMAELSGKLVIKEPNVQQGQIVLGQMQIRRDDISFILQESDLRDKKLSSSLYMLKPLWFKVSENNADIIEAEVLIVVLDSLEQNSSQVLNLLQEKIVFETSMFSSVESYKKQLPQDLIFLPFSLSIPMSPQMKLMIGLGGGVLSLILLIFMYRYFSKRRAKAKQLASRKERYLRWRDHFTTAKKRSDFEQLYRARTEWKDLILDSSAFKSFNERVAEHQYRPEWSDDIFREIKLHHERLLSMLKEER